MSRPRDKIKVSASNIQILVSETHPPLKGFLKKWLTLGLGQNTHESWNVAQRLMGACLKGTESTQPKHPAASCLKLCKLWAGAPPPLDTGRSESSRDPPRTCREWGSECWSPNQAPLSTRADNPTTGRAHHPPQVFRRCGGCSPMRMGVTPHAVGWLFLEDPEWAPAASALLPVLPCESSLPTLGESFTHTDS